MVLPTEPRATPVASKPYDLFLKHHKFVKKELTKFLEAGLIERSLSPYAALVIVVPHKTPPRSSLIETKGLVIDYCEVNKQLPKVQTVQAKPKGIIVFIETAKIDPIWVKLKGARYFSSPNIKLGIITFLYTQSQDQKLHLFVLMINFSGKELAMKLHMPQVFSYP